MKKKRFRIYFKNGESMISRNKEDNIGQVRSWARASNRAEKFDGWKIAKVAEVKARKKPKRRTNQFGFAVPKFKIPKLRF